MDTEFMSYCSGISLVLFLDPKGLSFSEPLL